MKRLILATAERRTWGLVAVVALALGLGVAAASRGQDDITCFCRLALLSGSDPMTGGVEIRDWQSLHVYNSSPFEMTEFQVKNCASRCLEMAQKDPSFSDPAGLCKKVGHAFDGRRQATARLQDMAPVRAFFVPLKCCPVATGPVACPSGWTVDASGPAGLKCRRTAGHLAAEPLPPNGTAIGTWGIVLGSDVWQWGPPLPPPPGSATALEYRPCS
ncbi:MAG: hypothetical protein WAM82_35785 [Thermoanaerobaculia bacterium]